MLAESYPVERNLYVHLPEFVALRRTYKEDIDDS